MNRRRLTAGIAGTIVLFAVCTLIMLYWYPPARSIMSLTLFLLPVIYAALFFSIPGGLITALAATAATSLVVFLHTPELTYRSVGLSVFVFFGVGVLVGHLARMQSKLSRKTEQLERASQRLKESEESYRLLFHRIPVGLYRTSREGSIAEANDAMARMLGYPGRAGIIGRNFRDFYVQPSQRDTLISMLEKNGTVKEFETQLIRADGKHITTLASVQWVADNDLRKVVFEGSIIDVTDKKKLEEQRAVAENQLKRAERMAAVAELAAGVAHDFNNILAGIGTQAQVISIAPALKERERAAVGQILAGVNRASGVIDGLLAAVGSHLVSPRSVDLKDVVQSSFEKGAGTLDESVRLSLSLTDRPLPVSVDPAAIERCICELIQNAVQSINGAGLIEVSCDIEPLQYATLHSVPVDGGAAGYACISVTDNGAGMDEQIIDRIFEPYFTTHEFGSGDGIGLTVVYGLVRQQNGLIGVQSAPGHGTTVKLYFPITALPQP